jgi:hypothetical protein
VTGFPISDARFSLPRTPPFPPGMSPFKVGGSIYRGFVNFVNEHVEGGISRVRDGMEGDQRPLGAFIMQDFHAAARYDVIPLPFLGTEVARIRHITFEEQLREANRWNEGRIGALYRTLLSVLSADMLALALPRAASILQDFGKTRVRASGSKHVEGVRTGVPEVLVRWLAVSTSSYIEAALTRAGANQPHVVFTEAEPDVEVRGQPTYAMKFEVSWS